MATLGNVTISSCVEHLKEKGEKKKLQARAYAAEKEIKKPWEKIENSAEQNSIQVQHLLSAHILTIMMENNSQIEELFPSGSFRRLFWDQQFQAAKSKD